MLINKVENTIEELEERYFEDEEFNPPRVNSKTLKEFSKSNSEKAKAFRLHVGMRNLKTALAATLCALLYFPINRNPTFACIGAIFGMGRDLADSKVTGGNRFFGTIVGGFLGMLLYHFYVQIYPDGGYHPILFLFLFIGVILLVIVCQLLVWPGAIQAAGVVLCVILFNTPVDSYISYSLNRILDTSIGVLIAIAVNVTISKENLQRLILFLNKHIKKQESGSQE